MTDPLAEPYEQLRRQIIEESGGLNRLERGTYHPHRIGIVGPDAHAPVEIRAGLVTYGYRGIGFEVAGQYERIVLELCAWSIGHDGMPGPVGFRRSRPPLIRELGGPHGQVTIDNLQGHTIWLRVVELEGLRGTLQINAMPLALDSLLC